MSLELAASKYLTKWTQIHKKREIVADIDKILPKN